MYKIILFVLTAIILTGCVVNPLPTPKPTGKFVWTNAPMVSDLQSGVMSYKEWQHKFVIAESLCTIESLQIPIPSPSCTTTQARDCSGMTGVALGMCQAPRLGQQCNYSSVNAAKQAQEKVFNSCMFISDWELIWQES
jgi:hypothetical protein